MKKSSLDEEEEALRKAINQDPNDKEAWVDLGHVLRQKNDLNGAEEAFRKVLEIDPQDAEGWLGLGVVLDAKKDFEGAEEACRKVLEIYPNATNVWFNLALLLSRKEDLPGAENAYRKVLELDPQDAQACLNLGGALERQEDLKGAEAAYREAAEIDPNYLRAWVNFGRLLEQKGDSEGAEAAYRKALELDPYCTIVLGYLLRVTGNMMYIPKIITGTPKRRYQLGSYEAVIVGDIKNIGGNGPSIFYEYLLFLYEQGQQEPIYFVSAERNNLIELGGSSHFLCAFEGTGHVNFGGTDALANLDHFTKEALQIVAQKFNLPKESLPNLE